MRAVRLLCCFITLTMALILEGCNPGRTAQDVILPAKTTSPTVTVVPTALPTRTLDAGANPIRLIIPAIAVNARVESVGILPDGDMATPTLNPWENVGWYKAGPHPGEPGSAVIDGHLDRPGGYPAVFWNLRDLHVGDKVLVMNMAGKTLSFRVIGVEFYTPQTAPLQDIFANRNGTYLNLITCAGDWIPSQHQTTLRLVVYTVLV